ncbi:sugar ABC transporter substrate-binding protein [Propioniciclava soli]|uniref:Sugar ABC transporter substrate-binding protein n=2 Tax=Propioniciclava soli TaxID=2775081 RepID=A0ABZ3C5W0_9ACTN
MATFGTKIWAIGAAAALALAGCAGGTGAGTGSGTTGSGDAASGGTDAPESLTLVAAEYSSSHTKAFWDQFATAYEEKTGIPLEVQIVSWDSIDQQSSTMIQNNQAPDILNLNVYASYAADDLLWNSDEVLPDEVKDDILDTFVTYGTYDGDFYGFPDLSSARAFFYNTDLFERAGIAAPPTTWDEFRDAAEKITALGDGSIGYAMPLGPEEAQGEFSIWTFNNGGDWKSDGSWAINSPENVETLTFMKELADAGLTQNNPARTNRADAFDLFKSGRVGMVVGFSPLVGQLDEEGTVNYAVAPMPVNDGGEPRTFGVTDYLMAFKKDNNQEAVRAFYELYYTPEQVNAFIEAEGFLPVTESGLEYFSSNPDLEVYLDTLPNVKLTPTDDPTWDRVKLAVQQNIGAGITGDPQATLDQLQQTAESGS